ncbi:hypothetical protein VaNZ11_013946 [Volvox africanus]|uniref:Lipoxygenase domain-containing protein n=1 Tax=Volvox africanus TaxID=51714 RepID=A0ABQ5SIP8_9CHLO|nr:hypothetical protein VaNZ11_013946 [Volvox africanus]
MNPGDYDSTNVSNLALAQKCVGLLRLLHAVDCFPRGGLHGYYAVAAAVRYERIWVNLMRNNHDSSQISPPLDIAFAWFTHRQDPAAYFQDRQVDVVDAIHPDSKYAFKFGLGPEYIPSPGAFNRVWEAAAPSGHAPWPPPAPGSLQCNSLFAEPTVFAGRVAASMGRFTRMLRSWLRPQYLDELFLERAVERYVRFLQLHRDHPEATLIPTADIALMWHTHLGLSREYAEVCKEMFGTSAQGEVNLWRPDYLDITDQCKLAALYVDTARLFRNKYEQAYDSHETAWLADTVPYPLATTGSPLAYALRVFDDNPDQKDISLICKDAGIPEPQPGEPVVRNGAHALYLTWLAAHRAMLAYEHSLMDCCWTRKTICNVTLGDVTSSLVSIAYFLELPDIDTHPYLLAIITHNRYSTSTLFYALAGV